MALVTTRLRNKLNSPLSRLEEYRTLPYSLIDNFKTVLTQTLIHDQASCWCIIIVWSGHRQGNSQVLCCTVAASGVAVSSWAGFSSVPVGFITPSPNCPGGWKHSYSSYFSISAPTVMRCWNSRSRSTLTVSDVAWYTLLQHGNSSWSLGLEPCDQSCCQGFSVLTVLRVNSPWFMGNNTNIMRMQSDRVTSNGFSLSKYSIILFASSVSFCCRAVLQIFVLGTFLGSQLVILSAPSPLCYL